jgi:hypothetical protein
MGVAQSRDSTTLIISLNGEKLFEWIAGGAEIARLQENLSERCRASGFEVTPEQMARQILFDIYRGVRLPGQRGHNEYIIGLALRVQMNGVSAADYVGLENRIEVNFEVTEGEDGGLILTTSVQGMTRGDG